MPYPFAGMALTRAGPPDAQDAVTEPPITMTDAFGGGVGSGGVGVVAGGVGGGGVAWPPGSDSTGSLLFAPVVFSVPTAPAVPPGLEPAPDPGPAVPPPVVPAAAVPAGSGDPMTELASGVDALALSAEDRNAARIEDSETTGVWSVTRAAT